MNANRHSRIAALVTLAAALGACAGPAPEPDAPQPVVTTTQGLSAILANVSTPDASREAADAKLKDAAGAKAPARLAILEQIVWAPGNSDDMRIYALDQLAAADPARAGRVLTLYLPRLESWPVLEHACDMAVKLGDLRVADALVRSLARPAKSYSRRARPEASALVNLTGRPLETALWDKFMGDRDTSVRVAALDLLHELCGMDKTCTQLQAIDQPDNFLHGLQEWVRQFGTLPQGPQEVAWALALQTPDHTALRALALARHDQLKSQSDYIAAPRFVHVLAHAPDSVVALSRRQLITLIGKRLQALRHVPRAAHYAGSSDDIGESFAKNKAKLSHDDLLTIAVLLDGLRSADFDRQIVRMGLDDMSDTTSEHGGLLRITSAPDQAVTLAATLYPPLYTGNDQAYISGDQLMADTLDGLAQFHLHFQQVFNAANAGPGDGDLAYAANNHLNAVVFTSVGKGEFNADYYTPAGAVVDLGVYAATP